MSWLDRPEKKSSNPATKFLEWKSNDKCFAYYDKEKGENVKVELPLKFVILEHYHTVKGWNDKTESGIYSNEVLFIGTEEMSVKAFKGGEIASGLYKEIKNKVKDAGGVYHRSIYVVLADGSLANIQLKGSAVSAYSDFTKEHENKWTTNWMEVSEAKDGKKGAVKFSTPVFKVADKIKDPSKLAEKANELQEYMNEYMAKDSALDGERTNSEVDKYHEKSEKELADDLDF